MTGTAWSVTFDGVKYTSPTPWSATISIPGFVNDTYPFTAVSAETGYVPTPTSGNVTVYGSNATQIISYVQWHSITFTETGLPTGQVWSVYIAEMASSLGNNSPAGITWTLNNTFNMTAANGTYTYSVNPVPGYDSEIVTAVPYCTSLPDGATQCNITQVDAAVAVSFHASPIYTLQFNETGLSPGTAWSVTFDGATIIGTGATISFGTTNGTYAYSIGLGGINTGVNGSTPSAGTLILPEIPCTSPDAVLVGGCTTSSGDSYLNITFYPFIAVSVSFPVGAFHTNGLPYITLPTNVTWNVTVTNTNINASTISQTLEIIYLQPVPTPGCGPFTYPCPIIWSTAVPAAWEQKGATAQHAGFYFNVNAANLTSLTYLGYHLPQGQWQIEVQTTVVNLTSLGSGSGSVVQATFISIVPPNGVITTPLANANGFVNITAGSETIAGSYSGYFVVSANITVIGPSKNLVLSASVYAPATTTNPFAVSWLVSVPGQYHVSLTMVAAWHLATYANETVNVTAGVPITYLNKTGLTISGLGNGGTAALFVTLGAIIGMIVMALIGRSLWGGTKPSPAQPWTPQPSPPSGPSGEGGGMAGGGTGGGSGGMGGGSGGMSGGSGGMGGSGGAPPS